MAHEESSAWQRKNASVVVVVALLASPLAAMAQPLAGASGVGDSVTLYLHGAPTGVGPADVFLSGSTMDEQAPTKPTPSVWYSLPGVSGATPNTLYEANWRYLPAGGYAFADSFVTVTFWAASPGGALGNNGWNVRLYNDGALLAERLGGGDFPPATPGAPAEYAVTFGPLDAVGADLTLQINPQYVDADYPHLLLFDSTDFPSRLQVAPALDTTPPSQVTGLAATPTSTSVSLAWDAAADDVGVHHYVVYRDAVPVGQAGGTTFLDAGLAPTTTYRYQVSAVDAAGNEGPASTEVSASTLGPDATPPVISGVSIDAGATVLRVRWTTDEPATSVVDHGATTAYGSQATSPRGTTHEVVLSGLGPGQSYHLRIAATDDGGNSATTGDLAASTTLAQVFYLHNRGAAFVESMDEIDSAGDNDGRGWNVLGTALATANHQAGTTTPLGEVADVYPALNPGVRIDRSREATATVFLSFPTSAPNAGDVHPQTAGALVLTLSLVANGGVVVGSQTVTQPVVLDAGYVPVEFAFPITVDGIDGGSLRAELRAQAGTVGYRIGYEGDHASRVSVPVQAGLPLQARIVVGSPAPYVEDVPLPFSADIVGGVPPYKHQWTFEGGRKPSKAPDPVHAFAKPGEWTVRLSVRDHAGNRVNAEQTLHVLQRDFVKGPRVVVAVLDSGINPYHPKYARPGAVLPLADFADAKNGGAPPRVVDLAEEGTYAERALADRETWDGVGVADFVHFNDTNVLGVSFHDPTEANAIGTQRIRDINGHGTATTSTVLASFPDAIILMVQPTVVSTATGAGFTGESMAAAIDWVVAQPWIDVISISAGSAGNLPTGTQSLPAFTKRAVDAGKSVVISAGNDPSPLPSDYTDGPPWVVSVTGSQADGQAKEILSSNIYPDYSADYTVMAAAPDTVDDAYVQISGTSFSCPAVAGVIAGVVHGLREATGHRGGIEDGELAPGVRNWDVRDALNKTAFAPPYQGYVAGTTSSTGDHANVPLLEFLTIGWGEVDASIIGETVRVALSGDDAVPPEKTATAAWKRLTYAYREAYWNAEATPAPEAEPSVPGPAVRVVPIPTIETPHPYPASADLTWTITQPGATAISVHFEDFDVESGYDLVFVEDPAGNVFGTYTSEEGLDFWSSYVPGDTVIVRLTSDELTEKYGFVIHEIDVL